MRDHRQGNDLAVVWSILRDGKPFILSGKEWKLYLKNMYERKEVDDFSVKGNQIHWTFYGKDQKTTGRYSLILVGNENEKGMITTDTCNFVNVVSCSCKVQNSEDSPNVETETIELTSNLDYVAGTGGGEGGGSYDDTAIWEALNDKVDKVEGLGLSEENYTTEEKAKLAGLENYDDAKLKEELSETYQPKGDYVETKNLATINGKPLNEGGNIEIESGSGGASIEVDDKLSTTSTNPVQNKVITAELNKKAETGAIPTKLSQLTDNVGFAKQADVEAGYQPKGDYVTDDKLSSKGYATEKYVDDAIEGVGEVSIDVDSVLSTTSENPVQNKVIYEALSTKLESEVVASSSPTEEIPLGYDDTEIWAKVDELSAEVSGLSERIDNLPSGESDVFKAIYGTTTYEEVSEAYNQGKIIHCDYESRCYELAVFTGNIAWFSCLNTTTSFLLMLNADSSWSKASYGLENADNRVDTIQADAKPYQYPSAKAVYDALQNVGGGASSKRFASLYETTIEAETDRLDLITLVPNILDNKDFVIGMELVAGDGTTARNMSVNFSAKNAGFNCCRINGLNKQSYQIFYLVKIHIGNDWMFDSSCYVECHNNSWNNEQKADGLQGLNLFIYQQNAYPIDTMYITFPFKVGDKIRIYGK